MSSFECCERHPFSCPLDGVQGLYILSILAVRAVERIVGNWFVNRYPARGSLWFARVCFGHSGSFALQKGEKGSRS